MKDLIKEVALYVGREMFDCERPADAAFFEACLIELSKRADAVGYVECHEDGRQWIHRTRYGMDTIKNGDRVFTFPPIHDIEAIENRTAEACAKHLIGIGALGDGDFIEAIRSGEWRKYK